MEAVHWANRSAAQMELLDQLEKQRVGAIRDCDFLGLQQLDCKLANERARLARLDNLPSLRILLEEAIESQKWRTCHELQKDILAVEHGHWGYS